VLPVPEFINPRFRENKPKCSFSGIKNERIGLVFTKTRSIISGTGGGGLYTGWNKVNNVEINVLNLKIYLRHQGVLW
jgi:hypothetical protein